MTISVRRLGAVDDEELRALGHLFDQPPTASGIDEFGQQRGHHLLVAYDGDAAVGFATCIEMAHPDKGTELMIYELGVDEPARRRGVGRLLVDEALALARHLGCYGAWTLTEDDNEAALATYRSAGASADATTVALTWDWRQG